MQDRIEPMARRQALLIGTSHYHDPALQQLRAPARDVADLAEVLRSPDIGGFDVMEVTDDGYAAVREKIDGFCTERNRDDLVLIYLSCHGLLDDQGGLYYAAADTKRKRLASTAVEADWLNKSLDRCVARRQILILDCCHSGGFAGRAKGSQEALDPVDDDLGLRRRFESRDRGRIILTASRKTEYSFEGSRPVGDGVRSVFTRILARGLRTGEADRDGDGWITHGDVHGYIQTEVPAEEPRQHPQMWASALEGEFVFARSIRGSLRELALVPEVGDELAENSRPTSYPVTSHRRRGRGVRRVVAAVAIFLAGLAAAAIAVFSGAGDHSRGTAPTATSVVRWAYPTKEAVNSPPAVADGTVYFGSDDGYIYALNATTGHLRWKCGTEGPIESRPAVANGTVYVGSGDGHLYAIDADTGTVRWSYETGIVVFSSPVVAAGLVYVGTHVVGTNDGLRAGRVYAINASTGLIRWSRPTPGPVDSSPAVTGGIVYVGSDDHAVYALSASTGNILWRYSTEGPVKSSPVVTGGVLYVGSDDGTLYALNARTGYVRWTYKTGSDIFAGPAAANGIVYVGSDNGNLYAINAGTGRRLWFYPTEGPVDSSPKVVGGTVYVGSNGGAMYAINGTTGNLEWAGDVGSIGFSGPAVVGNVAYIGSNDGRVYAMSGKS